MYNTKRRNLPVKGKTSEARAKGLSSYGIMDVWEHPKRDVGSIYSRIS